MLWLPFCRLLAQVSLDQSDEVDQFSLRDMNDGVTNIVLDAEAGKLNTLTARLQRVQFQLEAWLTRDLKDDSSWCIGGCGHPSLAFVLLTGLVQLLQQRVAVGSPVSGRKPHLAPRNGTRVDVGLSSRPAGDE